MDNGQLRQCISESDQMAGSERIDDSRFTCTAPQSGLRLKVPDIPNWEAARSKRPP